MQGRRAVLVVLVAVCAALAVTPADQARGQDAADYRGTVTLTGEPAVINEAVLTVSRDGVSGRVRLRVPTTFSVPGAAPEDHCVEYDAQFAGVGRGRFDPTAGQQVVEGTITVLAGYLERACPGPAQGGFEMAPFDGRLRATVTPERIDGVIEQEVFPLPFTTVRVGTSPGAPAPPPPPAPGPSEEGSDDDERTYEGFITGLDAPRELVEPLLRAAGCTPTGGCEAAFEAGSAILSAFADELSPPVARALATSVVLAGIADDRGRALAPGARALLPLLVALAVHAAEHPESLAALQAANARLAAHAAILVQ